MQDFNRIRAKRIEYFVTVSLDDLHTYVRIGALPRNKRCFCNDADRGMDGAEHAKGSSRTSLLEVAENFCEVGQRCLAVVNLHVTPTRFQKAATSSSEAIPLCSAALIAA